LDKKKDELENDQGDKVLAELDYGRSSEGRTGELAVGWRSDHIGLGGGWEKKGA
jgi:hypothetical protein